MLTVIDFSKAADGSSEGRAGSPEPNGAFNQLLGGVKALASVLNAEFQDASLHEDGRGSASIKTDQDLTTVKQVFEAGFKDREVSVFQSYTR